CIRDRCVCTRWQSERTFKGGAMYPLRTVQITAVEIRRLVSAVAFVGQCLDIMKFGVCTWIRALVW
ncbi:MAG: hypothetical protein N3G20_06620, partial [Verrucomicrobiae bacterium]|nr:hypothetical protein [Verrucomicrobiae bacterium]